MKFVKIGGIFIKNKGICKSVVEMAIQLICPPKCTICEKILFLGETICLKCRSGLPLVGENHCMKCGKPLNGEKEYCKKCESKKYYFDRNVSLWTYSPGLKKSLYRFKYANRRYYAKFYAQEIYARYGNLIASWGVDAVIPVPLYSRKKKKRGYNQAEELAKELCRLIDTPLNTKYVARIKNTVPQKQLNETERQKNVKDVFQIDKSVVKLKKILLIDDIFTTGSTVNEISRIAKLNGCAKVYVVTLCVGRGY